MNKSMLDRYNMDIAGVPHLSLKQNDVDYFVRTTRHPQMANREQLINA